MDLNDLKKQGIIIKLGGEPYLVLKSQHAKTAQRRAFVRTTLKNLISGKTIEKTFNAGDLIEEADVEKSKATYLYHDKKNFHFMDLTSFEEISLSEEILGEKKKFLKEGLEVSILYFEGKPVFIELPQKVIYKVVEAPLAVRGDTEGITMKLAKLENGLEINVPFFIEAGEEIVVNTKTGEYIERVKKRT
ncbi:MAG: elongation factor P [Patescibacteria group bacterium]